MAKYNFVRIFGKIGEEKIGYVMMHIAVILFGFTGILGELISLSAVVLVWWRVLLTAGSLGLIILFFKKFKLKLRHSIKHYLVIGALIGFHWICFYGSVKMANASIALICMATTSFFTAITEPLILNKKINSGELLIGLLMIPGMYLIVHDISQSHVLGLLVGILAAFLSAVFTSFNKKYVQKGNEVYISMIEMIAACIFCSPFVVYFCFGESQAFLPLGDDLYYILLLSFFCTTIAFLLTLKSLNYITAFASNLAINLEPVYGIFLAIVILNQHKELSTSFYLGVILIMITVFSFPYISKKIKPPNEPSS